MTINDLPPKFVERMRARLGTEAGAFFDACSRPPVRGVRLRRTIADSALRDAVPWAVNGFYIESESRLGVSALHEGGAYYLQEPSAMVPVTVLDPQPGERVLDLCAAPGGKSTQAAALMRGRGLLVCNEPVPSRARILAQNIERMGVTNSCVTCALPWDLDDKWKESFDRILVDAPCSGEGMFRRRPESIGEWHEDTNEICAKRQSKILQSAARMLRPGGILVYSTCTFSPLENEDMIGSFLRARPDFELVPFEVNGIGQSDGMMTLYPHRIRGEGHFIAKLRRGEGEPGRREKKDPEPLKCDREPLKLMKQLGFDIPGDRVSLFAGRYVCLPEDMVPLRDIRVLRLGLHLCEKKGSTLIPEHALALAQPRIDIPVSMREAVRYIRGEALEYDGSFKGFAVIGCGGCPLGWGKVSDGWIKNHYPKALRKALPEPDQADGCF